MQIEKTEDLKMKQKFPIYLKLSPGAKEHIIQRKTKNILTRALVPTF